MDDKTPSIKQSDSFFTVLGNTFGLIGASWEALLFNLPTFVKIYLLPLLIVTLSVPFLVITATTASHDKANAAVLIIAALVAIGLAILTALLSIASIITQLASVRGKKICFSSAINKATPYFWRFIGLGILSTLIILAGTVVLVLPGLIATILLIFAGYILIDKDVGVIEAIKQSVQLSKANWKVPLSLFIVFIVIQFPTAIIPIPGVLIMTALSVAYFCLPAILYTRITKSHTSQR